jgi:hypothetical protein
MASSRLTLISCPQLGHWPNVLPLIRSSAASSELSSVRSRVFAEVYFFCQRRVRTIAFVLAVVVLRSARLALSLG